LQNPRWQMQNALNARSQHPGGWPWSRRRDDEDFFRSKIGWGSSPQRQKCIQLLNLQVMRKQKPETKISKMATGKRFPATTKHHTPIRIVASMPSPLQYLIAQRNLHAARPHPLAEGAD
jgi:hypothetical protein